MINTVQKILSIIKNGQLHGLLVVQCPYSKIAIGLLNVLQENGFINGYRVLPRDPRRETHLMYETQHSAKVVPTSFAKKTQLKVQHEKIEILLKYLNGKPAAKTFSLISKPSKKISLSITHLTTSPEYLNSPFSLKPKKKKKQKRIRARISNICRITSRIKSKSQRQSLREKEKLPAVGAREEQVPVLRGGDLGMLAVLVDKEKSLEEFLLSQQFLRKKQQEWLQEQLMKKHHVSFPHSTRNRALVGKNGAHTHGEAENESRTTFLNSNTFFSNATTRSSSASFFRPKPFINGIYILSTTKGIISHMTALKCNTGGTVLCKIQ